MHTQCVLCLNTSPCFYSSSISAGHLLDACVHRGLCVCLALCLCLYDLHVNLLVIRSQNRGYMCTPPSKCTSTRRGASTTRSVDSCVFLLKQYAHSHTTRSVNSCFSLLKQYAHSHATRSVNACVSLLKQHAHIHATWALSNHAFSTPLCCAHAYAHHNMDTQQEHSSGKLRLRPTRALTRYLLPAVV